MMEQDERSDVTNIPSFSSYTFLLFIASQTPLHKFIYQGSVDGLREFLQKEKAASTVSPSSSLSTILNIKDQYGYPPLICAACVHTLSLSLQLVSLLIEYGADVNLLNDQG